MPVTQLKTVITLVVIAMTLLAVLAREKHWEFKRSATSLFQAARRKTPEDAVYKMLDAARVGDTKAYLDCFSGKLRLQLSQVIIETSASQFSRYLTAQNSAFTGVAVSVTERPNPDTVLLRVEYVYPERNEVQNFNLRRDGEEWKIVTVTSSEQIKTLIPYGTSVTE